MKSKKYLIRTIGDILRLPDAETIARFLDELKAGATIMKAQLAAIQATAESMDKEMEGIEIFQLPEEIDWIDDNKGEFTTNFVVDGKTELQFVVKSK